MKRRVSLLLCLLLCCGTYATRRSQLKINFQNAPSIICSTDGGMEIKQAYDNEIKDFTLSITTVDHDATYNLIDVKSLKFLPSVTAIESTQDDTQSMGQPSFYFAGKTITIYNGTAKDCAVYSTDGMKQTADIKQYTDRVVIDLSRLAAGSYIVKTNANSIKIQIR